MGLAIDVIHQIGEDFSDNRVITIIERSQGLVEMVSTWDKSTKSTS